MGYNGPINPNPGNGEAAIIIYNYVPSLALGILATVLFALTAFGHSFWFFKYKGTKTFEGLIVFGCFMEVVGYVFRILSHYRPFRVDYFVVQYFLIVCAPVTFSAALYLALGYAARTDSRNGSFIPVSTKVFVSVFIAVDIFTTILQVAGAALIGVAESAAYQSPPKAAPISPAGANNILLAGLALQVASFTMFLALLTWVILKVVKSRSHQTEAGLSHTYDTKFLVILFLTSGMVYTRTIFRLAETAEGILAFASSSEALFGVFEFAPVWTAMTIWLIFPLAKMLHTMSRDSTHVKRLASQEGKVPQTVA